MEGDDLIAQMVKQLTKDELINTVVVSVDSDLYQLLGYCSIHNPRSKEMMTRERFLKMHQGLTPEQWPMVKALAGDSVDNIRGIEGVGSVYATRYVLGTLPASSKAYSAIISPLSQELVTKNLELVSLPHPRTQPIQLQRGEIHSFKGFVEMCEEYNFRSFLYGDNLVLWRDAFNME